MSFEGSATWETPAEGPLAPAPAGGTRRLRLSRDSGLRARDPAPRRSQGNSEAEARLEALRRETGVLAHDLNNLLNVILAANEAIAEAPPAAPETAELARLSQDAAEKAGVLLRRLTSLGQPEQAPPADGGQAIVSVARLARLSAAPSVMVEAQAAEEPLPCAVGSADLQSALLNLSVNANYAMPAGGCLRMAAARVELQDEDARALGLQDGAYAKLTVADTGAGMTPEVLARATEPHFTTRQGRGGTGLGLASVQAIAHRAGGRLVLASEVGRGTTATLYLPLI